MSDNKFDVAVVGAGIVGLATAYTAAKKGLKVVVFERNPKAIGASVRNFGLVWPVGQPAGPLLDRALRSREVWREMAREAGIWLIENGSLQLAYHADELAVIEEFYEHSQGQGYQLELLRPDQVSRYSPAVKTAGLRGALWSATECTVTSRQAIPQITRYLAEHYGVEFHFGSAVTHVESQHLSDFYDMWHAERIFICSGSEFETLYPRIYRDSGITKCKLQMLRTDAQPEGWQLGASLCAGLTLLHYSSFSGLPSLPDVWARYERENPGFQRYGVHVLVSQNSFGELILGDSHEYGWDVSPFDKQEINQLILDYLNTFTELPDPVIAENWHGVYPKLPGRTDFVVEAEKNVWIVNGLSGAGMTMSFGLAQEIV